MIWITLDLILFIYFNNDVWKYDYKKHLKYVFHNDKLLKCPNFRLYIYLITCVYISVTSVDYSVFYFILFCILFTFD